MSLKGINWSNDAERGEAAAVSREGRKRLSADINASGPVVHKGVEFYASGEGGVAMRLSGTNFTDIICSQANAKPADQE